MKLSLALLVLIVASAPSKGKDGAPKGKAVPRLADLSCKLEGRKSAYPADINGILDIDALTLQDSRSGGGKAGFIAETDEAKVVDERCGKLLSPLADNYNYYVTPLHYWGEDILQLPKTALSGYGKSAFKARLHACQYDGEWHADWDYVYDCTLTAR